MSVTGVLLMYEKQMTAWADRGYRVAPPSSGAARLPVETLLGKVREERSALPSTFTLRSDPAAPAALGFGRESILYINPYTGEILGEGAKGIRTFFRVVTDWHRWLGAQGENRNMARAVTGACNLGFLFLVMSGFYIWWPKQWTWSQLRNVTWFRRGLPGKARDFNWHNVIGFWSAIPLFIVVLSATVISYPWASNLVYRLVGEEPPVQGGQAPGGGGPQRVQRQRPEGEQSRKSEGVSGGAEVQRAEGRSSRGGESRPRREGSVGPGGLPASPPADLNLEGFDALWTTCGATARRLAKHQLAAAFLSKCTTGIHDRPRQRWSAPETGSAHFEPGNWRGCALGAVFQHDSGPQAPDGVAVCSYRGGGGYHRPDDCRSCVSRCVGACLYRSCSLMAPLPCLAGDGGGRRNRSRQP